jgi:hypothetical protein
MLSAHLAFDDDDTDDDDAGTPIHSKSPIHSTTLNAAAACEPGSSEEKLTRKLSPKAAAGGADEEIANVLPQLPPLPPLPPLPTFVGLRCLR